MNVTIRPQKLCGTITPPPSKSRWLNLKAIRHSPPPSMTRTASAARGGSGSSA